MTYETIQFEPGAIARITLNRPDRLNSFTAHMHGELRDALANLDEKQARALQPLQSQFAGRRVKPVQPRKQRQILISRQLVVDASGGVMQLGQDAVEWVLLGAGVAPRGAGPDLLGLEHDHAGTALGGEGRGGAADDPAADDEQVRTGAGEHDGADCLPSSR